MRSFCLAWVLLCVLSARPALGGVTYYDPGPRGKLQVSRPTLGWKIWTDRSSSITRVRMSLNGRSVQATYSVADTLVSYQPDKPLSPGLYSVECQVEVNHSYNVTRQWEFTVAAGASANVPEPTDSQRAVAAEVNRLRAALSLQPFRLDARLCAAAAAHNAYRELHPSAAHEEREGTEGFTGTTPTDRAMAFGYPSGSAEDVGYGRTAAVAVRGLFDAPYHRLPFLEPGSADLGTAYNGRHIVLEFVGQGAAGVMTYPYEGQLDAPRDWRGGEWPDPLRMHGAKAPVGYPIAYTCSGRGRIKVRDVRLTTADGQAVPIYVNTPANDEHLTSAVLIIPRAALKPGATYRASVTATTQDGADISRVWAFTTQGARSAAAPGRPAAR